MNRVLVMALLVGCSSSARPLVTDAGPPDAPGWTRARVTSVKPVPEWWCGGATFLVDLVVEGREERLYDAGVCWRTALQIGDTVPVRVGLLQARVVEVAEEASSCGGSHAFLVAVVDGKVKRLHAGGHCLRSNLEVGDSVTVRATFLAAPTTLPNPGAWVMGELTPFDGHATIVWPPNAFEKTM